jgi:hypothetical protein
VLLLRLHQTGERVSESAHYLEPTRESGRAQLMRGIAGPVLMLNLLRFRAIADYSASPELAPSLPISGAAAFDRYVMHTPPLLRASGGDVILLGSGDRFLIGPAEELWNLAMLVRQHSIEASWRLHPMLSISRVSAIGLQRSTIRRFCHLPNSRCDNSSRRRSAVSPLNATAPYPG